MIKTLPLWIEATRPKTLIASLSPIVIGSFLAFFQGTFSPVIAAVTLSCALSIQITTNLANDLFDFLKGSDTAKRKGPRRLTQSRLISIHSMKKAVLISMLISALLGSYLVFQGGIPFAILLTIALACSILYTAGPYPLAYIGLGEVFVFCFFGPIATAGTFCLQTGFFSLHSFLAGIGPGLLSTAILVINHLRDIEEDTQTGKKTLTVRFGPIFGKVEYTLLLLLAPLLPLFLSSSSRSLFSFLLFLPEIPLLISLWKQKEPHPLLLETTAKLLLLYTLVFVLSYG